MLSAEADIEGDLDEYETDGTFSCDGCGCMISGEPGTIWYRCSECVDIDFCLICHEREIHSQHKKFMCQFKCPEDWSRPFCDCCGRTFPKSLTYELIWCKLCQDFSMCNYCSSKNRHYKHRQFLHKGTIDEYIKELY